MTPLELSACVELLFAEAGPELTDRIAAAGAAGLPAVEFWTWRERDLGAIASAVAEAGVAVTSFLATPTGLLAPDAPRAVADAAAAARRLGCPTLIVTAGDRDPTLERAAQRSSLLRALQRCGEVAAAHDVTLALEPLNSLVDHVGTFLDSTAEGLDLVEAADSRHVRLLFDLYHATAMGEDWPALLHGRMELVAHVHVADAPGRHEPGTGTIDWPAAMQQLGDLGYRGHVGLEYEPAQERSEPTLRVIRDAVRGAS